MAIICTGKSTQERYNFHLKSIELVDKNIKESKRRIVINKQPEPVFHKPAIENRVGRLIDGQKYLPLHIRNFPIFCWH